MHMQSAFKVKPLPRYFRTAKATHPKHPVMRAQKANPESKPYPKTHYQTQPTLPSRTPSAPPSPPPHPGRLNASTPNVGVSTLALAGTPSALRRSKKLWHSQTTSSHSASARPAYFAEGRAAGLGGTARGSAAAPCPCSSACAGPGSRGASSRMGVGSARRRSVDSSENLKQKVRNGGCWGCCAASGLGLRTGDEDARAVESRARVVGEAERARCCFVVPIIVRRMPQRLAASSSCSELDVDPPEVGRKSTVGRSLKEVDTGDENPSIVNDDNPRAVEINGSVRIIMKHRPGAGLHGVVLGS